MKKIWVLSFAIMEFTAGHAQISDSSKREIKLAGAANFRDLGGYTTTNGKHVKWGKIYRSAALNQLTESDIQELRDLKISIDADFRGPYEVKIAPDRIPDNTYRISLPAGSEDTGTPGSIKKFLSSNQKDSGLIAFYANTAILKDRYKPVFEELLRISPDSALLFHCTAGKDRTGIAAALVLHVLGVPDSTIMNDYLASNYYRKNVIEKEAAQMEKYFNLSKEDAIALSGVKSEYLIATYQAIIKKYGSMNAFLEKDLGLTPSKIKALRKKYTE